MIPLLALELFSPDLVVTNTAGEVKDRTGEVADVRPEPGLSMHYFRTADVRAREYARVGVVIGRAEWEFELGQGERGASALHRRVRARWIARMADGGFASGTGARVAA